MKKTIWIINHYAGDMYFERGGRHYYLAKYLKDEKFEPVIFCCNAKHGEPKCFYETSDLWQEHVAEEIEIPWVYVRARTYVGNGRQRIMNMLDFYWNVQKAAKEFSSTHKKPDIIYASSVHPLTLIAGLQLAKYFGVKCICEIRDLWPESLITYGILKQSSAIARLMYVGEKWIYKKADKLVFTMEGAYNYIEDRGWEADIPASKVFFINNGVDLESFDYSRNHFQFKDPDLDVPNTFKVIYAGSIRKANHIENILDAARIIQQKGSPTIQFLIYGNGEERAVLEKKCPANVIFKGYIEKKYIPYILSKSSVNLWNFEDSRLLKYGASPNKLFDYLASGKPTIATGKVAYDPLIKWQAGIEAESCSPKSICDAVLRMYYTSEEERMHMCSHARKAAEEFDFKELSKKLMRIVSD